MEYEVRPIPNCGNRYSYFRCSNEGDDYYTCVAVTGDSKAVTEKRLRVMYSDVVYRPNPLPAARLYILVEKEVKVITHGDQQVNALQQGIMNSLHKSGTCYINYNNELEMETSKTLVKTGVASIAHEFSDFHILERELTIT